MAGTIIKTRPVNSLAYRRFFHTFRNGQKGSILIGLIIAMIILSTLGAGMVYFFGSSVMDPVFSNFSQRSYYAAESGMRYAVSIYRNTIPAMTKSQFISQLNGHTLSFPNNNGQAILTITDKIPVTASPTTVSGDQTISTGGDLVVASTTNFPDANGFFQIGPTSGNTTYYRYRELNGNTLKGILGTIVAVADGTAITLPQEQVLITSNGYYPQTGIFGMSRKVQYSWVLSGIPPSGTPPIPPPVINLPDLVAGNPFGNDPSLGQWTTELVDNNTALTVNKSTSGTRVEAVIGYSGEPNPFRTTWINELKFLSYDAQVKVATGTPSDSTFINKPDSYVAGLTFRSTETTPGKWRSYGLSFMNYGGTGIPQALQPRLYAAWINKTYNSGEGVSILDNQGFYTNYICNSSECPAQGGKFKEANGWQLQTPPMILLWSRGGRSVTDSGDRWLAYKLLADTDYVVDANGKLKDWSTILLRIIEAASIKIDDTTADDITTGITITDDTGKTAKVYRKIKDNDGKIVLLLHNVQEGFTRPVTAGTHTTDSTWGFRSRDNYIWAMFGDTDQHLPANNDPLNNYRNANPRLTDAESEQTDIADPTSANQKIFWPPDNMADWGNTLANGTTNDYFKLVQWNTILNTTLTENMSLYIMGTVNESGAILRTNLWTTEAYVSTAFPHEFGVHALGDQAVNTYFDDLALNFQGQSSGGGIPYLTPIQE